MQKCFVGFFFCRNLFWWIKDQHSVKSVEKAWPCLIWAPPITSGMMQYVDVNAVYDLLYASIFTCIYRWPIDTFLLRNYLFHFNIQTMRSQRVRSANRYYTRICPKFIFANDTWCRVYIIAWFSPADPCCTPAGPRWLGRPTEGGGPGGRRPRARAPPAAAGPVPRPGTAHRPRSHSPPTWKRSTTKSRGSPWGVY